MVQKAKKTYKETLIFLKKLFVFTLALVALLPVVAGALTAIHARTQSLNVTTIAALVSGASTVLLGFLALHYVLMRKTA